MFELNSKMTPFFIATWLICVIFIFFLMAFTITIKKKRVMKAHELLKALVDEKERTMYTISSEIHDNINQVLYHTQMTLKMANKHSSPTQQPYLNQATKLLAQALKDLRNISHSLNSSYLKNKGVIQTLQEEAARINSVTNIHCLFDLDGNSENFSPDIELMIIRIAQEIINNALKHANASKLIIKLEYGNDLFMMSIKDNGKGFILNPEAPWKGLGLNSIKERSRIIGMNLSVNTKPQEGTTITLSMPNPKYEKH
jgi:two-component system NarL family sensor kinase